METEILDGELVGSDYTIFRRDQNRHGGGVMLYVRSSISTIRRCDIETNCEVLWVELSLGTNKVLLGTFYRPPKSSPEYLAQLNLSLVANHGLLWINKFSRYSILLQLVRAPLCFFKSSQGGRTEIHNFCGQ